MWSLKAVFAIVATGILVSTLWMVWNKFCTLFHIPIYHTSSLLTWSIILILPVWHFTSSWVDANFSQPEK